MQLFVLLQCIVLLPACQSLEVFQLSAVEGPARFAMVPALQFLVTLPLQLLTGDTVAGVHLAAAGQVPAGEPLGGAVLAGVTVCSTTSILLPWLGAVDQGGQGHTRLLSDVSTDPSSTGGPDLFQGVSPACRQLASRGHWAEHCKVIFLAAEITEPELLHLLLFLVSFCSVPSPFPVEGPLPFPVQLQQVLPLSQGRLQ